MQSHKLLGGLRTSAVLLGAATIATMAAAQQKAAQAAQPPAQANSANTRFIEACNSAMRSGQPMPECNSAMQLRGNELEQLKQEALRTHNPQLMTMVGDSYQKRRTGGGDISQAFRWYVLGAVRGDPQAMARLSEMYRRGQGTTPDRVKAMGYAKLAQQVAPDSAAGKQAAQTTRTLSKSMAHNELAQADRFAQELAQQLGHGNVVLETQGYRVSDTMPYTESQLGGKRLPGETSAIGGINGISRVGGARQAAASGKQAAAGQAAALTLLPGQAAQATQASVAPHIAPNAASSSNTAPLNSASPAPVQPIELRPAAGVSAVTAGQAAPQRPLPATTSTPSGRTPPAPIVPAPIELRPAASPTALAGQAAAGATSAVSAVAPAAAPAAPVASGSAAAPKRKR